MLNKKYKLVQGINFLEVPMLNIKKLSNVKNMIKHDDSENFRIEKLFENEVVEPNIINIKNTSNDSILYFSSRSDVSRVLYDFRVFPKQEISYFLHEIKHLYCYLTQLNVSEISIDVNYSYNYDKNVVMNNCLDFEQLKYECLKIFDNEVIGHGDTTFSDFIDGLSWVKYFNLIINTNKNYDLYIKRKNSIAIEAYQSTLVSGAGATSVNASLFFIPSNTASVASICGHGISFGVKNNDGADDLTASLYIELFG